MQIGSLRLEGFSMYVHLSRTMPSVKTFSFQCIDHPTRWAIHQLKPLPNYVNGRVALLGDAVGTSICHLILVHT
jgi:hypothetical protein